MSLTKNIVIKPETATRLEEASKKLGLSQSALIENSLVDYFKKNFPEKFQEKKMEVEKKKEK